MNINIPCFNLCYLLSINTLCLFLIISGCSNTSDSSNEDKLLNPEKSVAYFDYFTYKGDDDSYGEKYLSRDAHRWGGVFFLSIANSFGFKGTTIGMYATTKPSEWFCGIGFL